MNDHPDRVTILMYVENDPSVDDPASLSAHIAGCGTCAAIMEEFREVISLLGSVAAAENERAELRTRLLTECTKVIESADSTDEVFAHLLSSAIDTWDAFFERHPEHRSFAMVRRLFEEVELEMNRRPDFALLIVGVAERIAYSFTDVEARTALGDAWKHRSNALRNVGRYEEALDAAELAEAFYTSLLTGAFDAAQAQYTRAVTLFKMRRFADAKQVLKLARETLREFGDSIPLAKTAMLEAAILMDEGDIAAAQERWRDVLPMLEQFGDAVERARVLSNLAECNLRLGNLVQAEADAQLAVSRYRDLDMETEAIRSEWTIGMVHLVRGEAQKGLAILEKAAASFELRGMVADAAFVKLDICEELLRNREWHHAELVARELVNLFTAAGVTLASVEALNYLRTAVQNRAVSAEAVEYVRTYVTADDPTQPFEPPPPAAAN